MWSKDFSNKGESISYGNGEPHTFILIFIFRIRIYKKLCISESTI